MPITVTRPTITAALIVKNAAKHLATCLASVHDWVDEIVMVDSGSTDETEAIARQFAQAAPSSIRFYRHTEWPGFGRQRQLAQSYVNSNFVLWLDADERVTAELKQSILHAIQYHQADQIYRINRLTTAFGKTIHYSGWSPDWVVRLYKTQDAHFNDALVHESVIIPKGFRVLPLEGRLEHFTFDHLDQYHQKTQLYMKSWADQHEGLKSSTLIGAIMHGVFRFLKMYILKLGFLDGQHGLLLALLSGNTTFSRYADLWLREYQKKHSLPISCSAAKKNSYPYENLPR
jgi:(heptosyl)LPS beta-1,4-glucosyltransferase